MPIIDAVVTAGDGRWAAFEVKLGQADIDIAAANLLTFARKVDPTKVGEPATLERDHHYRTRIHPA